MANITISLSGFKAGPNNTIYFGGTSSAQAPDLDWFEVINTDTTTTTAAVAAVTTQAAFDPTKTYSMSPYNATGLAVDVNGNNMANGTAVQQSTDNTTTAQKFFFKDGGSGTFYIQSGNNSSFCLDDNGSSTADGVQMQIFTCNQTNAQRWKVIPDPTVAGAFSLVNVAGNTCLDETSASTANGTRLQLWSCGAGNSNQRFYISAN